MIDKIADKIAYCIGLALLDVGIVVVCRGYTLIGLLVLNVGIGMITRWKEAEA